VRWWHDEALTARGIVRSGNVLRYVNSHSKVSIISITGQQVMHQAISGHGLIDISDLSPGVYFAKTDGTLLKFVR
jgi:hypothetical protein